MSDPATHSDEPFVTAEVVAEPISAPERPQPGIILAIGLCMAPLFAHLVLSIGFVLIFSLLQGKDLNELIESEDASSHEIYLLPLGTFSTLLVSLAFAILLFRQNTGRYLGWRGFSFTQLAALILFVFPLGILASEVTNLMMEMLDSYGPQWIIDFRRMNAESFEKLAELNFPLVFIAGCLLPGLGEEILCRGVVSRGLIARYGVFAGTIGASFLFGAMHIEPLHVMEAFLLGLSLQFVFLVTRSLAAPIFCHALNNTVAFLVIRLDNQFSLPGLSMTLEGSHVPTPVVATAAVALILAIALLLQIRTRWQLPDGIEWTPGYVSAECPPAEVNAIPVTLPVSKVLMIATIVAFVAMFAMLAVSVG